VEAVVAAAAVERVALISFAVDAGVLVLAAALVEERVDLSAAGVVVDGDLIAASSVVTSVDLLCGPLRGRSGEISGCFGGCFLGGAISIVRNGT
jgi:hypothetical protein